MISINKVRNTVLFLLNKNNRGYITPQEFDSFCGLAQLSLFEDLFLDYNKWLNKKNQRFTNTEYADIPANIQQEIDTFSEYSTISNFTYNAFTNLWGYTGNDLYKKIGLSLINAQGK